MSQPTIRRRHLPAAAGIALAVFLLTACDGGGISIALPIGAPFVKAVATGTASSCALWNDGRVQCWGNNGLGQLGQGDTLIRGDEPDEMGAALPPVDLGTGRTATALVAGEFHNCALLDDGTVKCWGYNFYGQLGLGDNLARGDDLGEMGDDLPAVDLGTGRTATALSAGYNHNCAVLDDATVRCWGRNSNGQLGLGNTQNRGNLAGQMGDALPPVDLGTGRTAIALALASLHTCALLDNATVKCWGRNAIGQLGLEDTSQRGDGAGEMGDALPALALGTGVTPLALTTAEFYTCVRLDDGTIKCWGYNQDGELGLGDTNARGDAPSEMGDNLPAVDLGAGSAAQALAGGKNHACVVLAGGLLKCWGRNLAGQLGLEDMVDRGGAPNEMGDNLPPVTLGAGRTVLAVEGGTDHSCAVLDDHTVKCWGGNTDGQLGLGDNLPRGRFPGEMGDDLPPVEL